MGDAVLQGLSQPTKRAVGSPDWSHCKVNGRAVHPRDAPQLAPSARFLLLRRISLRAVVLEVVIVALLCHGGTAEASSGRRLARACGYLVLPCPF